MRDKKIERKVDFRLGAKAVSCDLKRKELTCLSVLENHTGKPDEEFKIEYDKIVVGVGALSNTFGVKGVKEHALFLKVGFF